MKIHFLNKSNNSKIVLFFAGWSFDYHPFLGLDFGDYDVLMIYDYNDLTIPEDILNILENYEQKYLLAWSMGVFVAYLNKNLFNQFDKKIAVNGTIKPVDNQYGIPDKIFELTLKNASRGLNGKFYKNIFFDLKHYDKYLQNPVSRTIDNRVEELNNLYQKIKSVDVDVSKFYDLAFVSVHDNIIPSQNQINSHKLCNTEIVEIESGHFPYYGENGFLRFVK